MLTDDVVARERGRAVVLPSRAVLAVSGGADSMLMAARVFDHQPDRIAAIATVNHGTSPASAQAAALVEAWAQRRSIPVRVVMLPPMRRSEAVWRAARWNSLRAISREFGAPVAVAHTEDDQVETVVMRLLRGSGVRGLAGLLAPSPVLRPLLAWTRHDVRAAARESSIPFIDDPSNQDRRFLRNRVRLELLPRLEREAPGFRDWVLGIGRAAAVWRRDVAAAVDAVWSPAVQDGAMAVLVPRAQGATPTEAEGALFWPEVAGRVGIALDRRGTARLASFTTRKAAGREMPLSGGAVVADTREGWLLRRADADRGGHPSDWLAPRLP
jgi:tRNA(Ile)-lysidine synthase